MICILLFDLVNFSAFLSFNLSDFGNLSKLPIIFNLIFFLIKFFNSFLMYFFSILIKNLISLFGLFQFSVEKVNNVRYFIFFDTAS